MPDRPRLFTLPPSHYCERARWGLDSAGIAHVETRWAAGLHAPLARRMTRGTALPILDAGGAIIQGSGRILDWAGLGGGDPDLERRFDMRIGALARQYIYSATLTDPASGVRDALFDGVSPLQARLGRLFWPVTRRVMAVGMSARPSLTAGLARAIETELDWFEGRLDGRPFLAGDAFGRADITAASLLAPLARPEACPIYRRVRPCAPVEATLTRWSERPAMIWVHKVYAERRHRVETGVTPGLPS